jgi:hypothetical protein
MRHYVLTSTPHGVQLLQISSSSHTLGPRSWVVNENLQSPPFGPAEMRGGTLGASLLANALCWRPKRLYLRILSWRVVVTGWIFETFLKTPFSYFLLASAILDIFQLRLRCLILSTRTALSWSHLSFLVTPSCMLGSSFSATHSPAFACIPDGGLRSPCKLLFRNVEFWEELYWNIVFILHASLGYVLENLNFKSSKFKSNGKFWIF